MSWPQSTGQAWEARNLGTGRRRRLHVHGDEAGPAPPPLREVTGRQGQGVGEVVVAAGGMVEEVPPHRNRVLEGAQLAQEVAVVREDGTEDGGRLTWPPEWDTPLRPLAQAPRRWRGWLWGPSPLG